MADQYYSSDRTNSFRRIKGTFLLKVLSTDDITDRINANVEHTIGDLIIVSGAESAEALREDFTYQEIQYITPAFENPTKCWYKTVFITDAILIEFNTQPEDLEAFLKQYDLTPGSKSKYTQKFYVKEADDNRTLETALRIHKEQDVAVSQPNFKLLYSEETGPL